MKIYGFCLVVLFIAATYCVLAPRVNDGIVGKVLLSMVAMTSVSMLFSGHYSESAGILIWLLIGLLIRQFMVDFVFVGYRVGKK